MFLSGRKNVRYTFELEDGKQLQLQYTLQENSLTDRWIKEVKLYSRTKGSYPNLDLSNKSYTKASLVELYGKLNSIIDTINSVYEDKPLVPLKGLRDLNRENMNRLHEKFEEYGEKGTFGSGPWYRGERIHTTWLNLNDYIHITENALDIKKGEFPNYSCLATVFPPYPGKKLEEEDKIFLTTEFSWGHLYLGYNTLGKDFMSAAYDNDARVVDNEQVKIQSMYSSEAWLCFHERSHYLKDFESQFERWYKKLNQDTKDKIPLTDLSKLAFGRYYLGCIVVNRDLSKFHPIEKDWYNDANLQKRWNDEVFSKVKDIRKIEVYG